MWKVYRQRIHRDISSSSEAKNEIFLNNELEILQIEIATLSIWVEREIVISLHTVLYQYL
jgi:hypothetical protein